ncbi:MAG: hypothetical protein GY820_35920 [Gammaproteobacteria bacterium]|nr:hypothetical protein [Gammaproteobacteria bacterium]
MASPVTLSNRNTEVGNSTDYNRTLTPPTSLLYPTLDTILALTYIRAISTRIRSNTVFLTHRQTSDLLPFIRQGNQRADWTGFTSSRIDTTGWNAATLFNMDSVCEHTM